jgi:hypothetical protein
MVSINVIKILQLPQTMKGVLVEKNSRLIVGDDMQVNCPTTWDA